MQRKAEASLDTSRNRSDRPLGAPPEGVSLNRLLELESFSDAQSVALGIAVLRELVTLESAGRSHGDVSTRTVRVLSNGSVQLSGPNRSSAGSEGEDVRAAGQLVCAALGVGVEDLPEAAGQPERATRVVVTARAMAQGALGRRPATALNLFQQGVGRLGQPPQTAAALEELGAIARKLQHAKVAMPAPEADQRVPEEPLPKPAREPSSSPVVEPPQPPAAGLGMPSPPARLAPAPAGVTTFQEPAATGAGLSASWRLALQLILVAALVFLTLVQVLRLNAAPAQPSARVLTPPVASPSAVSQPVPTVRASTPTARQLQPLPVYAPAASGRISRLETALPAPCEPGNDCRLNLTVFMSAARAATPITWTVNVFDRCTGITDTVPGGRFVAPIGWVRVELTSLVQLSSRKGPLSIVVVTSSPDTAASPPIEVGPPGC